MGESDEAERRATAGAMQWLGVALLAAILATGCSPPEADLLEPSSRVALSRDVVYGHKDGLALTLNVYQPGIANGAGVIFLNSSGWTSPFVDFVAPDSEPPRLRSTEELRELHPAFEEFSPHFLLDAGFTVFEVRHGSSPRFVLPEMVSDVRRAVRFVKARSDEFGIDPDRIGVWGGSAGGHLALMLGLSRELEGGSDLAEARIGAVVAYFPVSDLPLWIAGDSGRIEQFPALDFAVEEYPAHSPVFHASADDPPTLIVHGDEDELVPLQQGALIHEALYTRGVQSKLLVIEGAAHGFVGPEVARSIQGTIDWFEEHIGGR